MKLDMLDRKIMYELDKNSRIPLSQLARKLKQSRERINYRLQKLNKTIINKFVTIINPAKLGYSNYKLFFKFQNLSKDKEKEIIDWLVKNQHVYWVASAQGRWDLNVTIFAKSIIHLDSILAPFINSYGKYIAEQEFNTTLEIGIVGKDWILQKEKVTGKLVRVTGEIENIKLDEIDAKILKIVATDARIPSNQLAKRIGTTQRRIIYRIAQLENQGIILQYTVSLNYEALNLQFFKATIPFTVMDEKTKKRIVEYCTQHPNIMYFVFCVGSWPLELEIVVKDNREFYSIMDEFRGLFPEMRGYDTLIFPREHKFEWMPLEYQSEKGN